MRVAAGKGSGLRRANNLHISYITGSPAVQMRIVITCISGLPDRVQARALWDPAGSHAHRRQRSTDKVFAHSNTHRAQ